MFGVVEVEGKVCALEFAAANVLEGAGILTAWGAGWLAAGGKPIMMKSIVWARPRGVPVVQLRQANAVAEILRGKS